MRIPFIGGPYEGRNPALDTQQLINFYIEGDPEDTRSPKYAVPTPGLTLVGQIANAQGRAIYQYAGQLWAVVGSTVYQVTGTNPLTTTAIGTLATSTGIVNIVDNGPNNGQQMLAIDTSGNGYVVVASGTQAITAASWTQEGGGPYTISGASWNNISTSLNFTTGASTVGSNYIATVTGVTPNGYNFSGQKITCSPSTLWTTVGPPPYYSNPGTYVSGGTLTVVSGTLSFTLSTAPTFSSGAVVVVTGCIPAAYNGTYTVATVVGNTFTVAHVTPNPGTFSSGGTVSGATSVTRLTNGINGWPVNGAGSVTFQDGYGLVSILNTNQVAWSKLEDFTNWPALSFNSKAAFSDNMNSVLSDGTKVYVLGGSSSEVWYDAGQQTTVFTRIPAAVYKKGCVASDSPAVIDNSVVWLGQSYYGKIQVYQMRGASPPVRISTPQMEYTMGRYGTVADAVAFVQQQDGHEFYFLTFPTAGATWVWDSYTREWHQRSSAGNFWLPISYAYVNQTHFVLDLQGNLYIIDPNNNTENGAAITRTITSPHFYGGNQYIRIGRIEVVTNNGVGTGPTTGAMTLSWTKEYGAPNTFNNSVSWNFTSSPTQRFYQTRLGRARDWVFNLTTTSNPIILDLVANSASPEEEAQAGAARSQ